MFNKEATAASCSSDVLDHKTPTGEKKKNCLGRKLWMKIGDLKADVMMLVLELGDCVMFFTSLGLVCMILSKKSLRLCSMELIWAASNMGKTFLRSSEHLLLLR